MINEIFVIQMSLESANKFLTDSKAGKVGIDISKVTDVTDHAAAMKYIHSFGYDFTEQEMLQAINESNFHGKKITMAGAEAVAGGSSSTWGNLPSSASSAGAACA